MNNPIRTALLSYGMSGRVFHGPFFKAHQGFQIVCVWQRDSKKVASHNFPLVHKLDHILHDNSIELVIVNTPNQTHFEYSEAALLAGKHVVVEKPFTVTSSEADRLISLAKSKNLLLTVYQNRRWDAGFLTIKKILQQNLIGKVVSLEMHYDRFRNGVDRTSWKENPQPGIGVLYNLGSHLIDQVLCLFGMPLWVDARVGIQRPGGMVDDYYDIWLEYHDFTVTLKSSYLVKEPGPSYQIHGTEGSYVKYGIDPQEELLSKGTSPTQHDWAIEPKEAWGILNTLANGKEFRGSYETVSGNYMPFYNQLYDAIRNNGVLPVDPTDSRNGIFLIEKCYQSSKERKAIKVS